MNHCWHDGVNKWMPWHINDMAERHIDPMTDTSMIIIIIIIIEVIG